MDHQPNFAIKSTATISGNFLDHKICTFREATEFIRQLPYGRNRNKNNLTSIFTDKCGTCSTKHALLKKLADENNFKGIDLILGLFKMNAENTPKIASTLHRNRLDYIPEAHNYLRFNNQRFDYTTKNSRPADFMNDLMEELIIEPHQIGNFKVAYHQKQLTHWLEKNPAIAYTFHEIWVIREQCIQDLALNN